MKPEFVSRYIRPEDIPLIDEAILEPILTGVARQMATERVELTVMEWVETLHKALLRGDLAIVIDDERKRLGIVPTDVPPYASLVQNQGLATSRSAHSDDPLGLKGIIDSSNQQHDI